MFDKVATLTVLVTFLSCTKSEPPSTDYGTPLGAPISSYGTPNYNTDNYGDHNNHDHGGEPKSYEFGYQVKDDYTGTDYNRQESSDGNQVRGQYRVALPDGRTQIVTYWADWQSGFHADVKYEGEAHYPEQYNKGGNGGGYNNGGYNGDVSSQYGVPAYANGYQSGSAASSGAINNLAGGHDNYNYNSNNNNNNYDSYNNGYSKAPPSTVYGPL
ncbi:unnamed protein product [Phaedon cochleariae]|uniref:Uncharacterized protein n=1 Tax=Phaedon cochleariae TaxID=80249 RepID=A0A9P0GSS4_PHACE|nr:unnamed protein product [Phaedon cochleariae]